MSNGRALRPGFRSRLTILSREDDDEGVKTEDDIFDFLPLRSHMCITLSLRLDTSLAVGFVWVFVKVLGWY